MDLDARLDEVADDLVLDAGEGDSEVGLQRENAVDLRAAKPAHLGFFLARARRKNDDLETLAQPIHEFPCARQRNHVFDHRLDIGEAKVATIEDLDATPHQFFVVRLITRRLRQLGNPGSPCKFDPDLGHEHAFEIEANDLHSGPLARPALRGASGKAHFQAGSIPRRLPATRSAGS